MLSSIKELMDMESIDACPVFDGWAEPTLVDLFTTRLTKDDVLVVKKKFRDMAEKGD